MDENNSKKIMRQTEYDKLQEELKERVIVRRPEIAKKIQEARAQGDLSENAEYDAAKEEQSHNESRIGEIQKLLDEAEVFQDDAADKDAVHIGCRVTIESVETGDEMTFELVGSSGGDSLNHVISYESPVGKAINGAKVGEVVEVEAPVGIMSYKVKSFEKIQ